MNKPNTICRVCRKEYYCCTDSRSANSWKVMACSPECYQEYMRRIEKSRSKPVEIVENSIPEEIVTIKPKTRKKKTANIENTDEE